jgi:hypothetical protein
MSKMTDKQLENLKSTEEIIGKLKEYAICGLVHNDRPAKLATLWIDKIMIKIKEKHNEN